MLTDSKVRQAGFIRNNSSRKVLYQQELQKKDSLDGSDDDSFSSFQYQRSNNVNYTQKQQKLQMNQYEQTRSAQKRQVKPLTPQIPPKPDKKSQIGKSSLENEKSKANFMDQSQKQLTNYRSKQQVIAGKIDFSRQPFPRAATPQFSQIKLKHNLSQVENIRNRIDNSKALQGNFSFNPKTNHLKKELQIGQREEEIGLIRNVMKRVRQVGMINKPKLQKQNNYFNNNPVQKQKENKFQYDFSSLSEEEQSEHSQQEHDQSFGMESKHPQRSRNNQKVQYQQKKISNFHQKVQQQQKVASITLPKSNFPQQGYNKVQSYTSQDNANNNNNKLQSLQHNYKYKRMQDDQSDDHGEVQELTRGYIRKTEFSRDIEQQISGEDDEDSYEPVDNYLQGLVQKQGGISFEVDVKHFSYHSQSTGERKHTNPHHHSVTKTVVNTNANINTNTHANNYKTISNNTKTYQPINNSNIRSNNNANINQNDYYNNIEDSNSNDQNTNMTLNRDPDPETEPLQPMNKAYTKNNNYNTNNYNTCQNNTTQPIRKSVTVTGYNIKRKKKGVDKQELLRRREMAKAYSQQARFRLFGYS